MITHFRHSCIIVSNLERALKFYRDILGLRVEKILTVSGKYPETVFNKKGVKLTYAKLRAPHDPKGSPPLLELHCWQRPKIKPAGGYNHISFTVKNLDGEYRRLRKHGVKFISAPITSPDRKTKICFGYDPDKNLIEFIDKNDAGTPFNISCTFGRRVSPRDKGR